MTAAAPLALRPRTSTELIDAAVQLFRQHYGQLAATTALFMIPVIVSVVALGFLLPPLDATALPGLTSAGWPFALVALLVFVLFSMSNATVTVIVSESYLGRRITIGDAVGRVVGRLSSVLGVAILEPLIITLGFFLFIIPGLVFQAWFFASLYVVVIEGSDTFGALGRSRGLARGSFGRILGTIFLVGVIVAFVQYLLGIVLSLIVVLFNTTSVGVALLPYLLAAIFIYPLKTAVMVLLYYDLRIRREGFDLAFAAGGLSNARAAAAT